MSLDGTYLNIAHGFADAFKRLGWTEQPHIYEGTHHGVYGTMVRWEGEGEPVYPKGWKTLEICEGNEAKIAAITEDANGRYITLGKGDGTYQRWKVTDDLLKKIRREINDRLD